RRSSDLDTRVMNYAGLPNTVFPITGATLPYDAYTGDMVHRFFHMWQQSDCDSAYATKTDPAGCKNDLYAYVGVSRGDDSGSNAMGFYNIQKGDAPIFKQLADEYTMSDNFHQSVMGGTAVQHIMLGYGDQIYWETVANLPAQPPANRIANPNPQSPTNDAYTVDERWTLCGDASSQPIMDYLKSLPWHPDQTASNCENGRFYMVNNARPAFLSNGKLNEAGIKAGKVAPPSSLRTLGDELNTKNVSWAYYGGGFDAAARFDNGSTDPVDVMIATNGNWYCDICNPFQYSANFPTYLKNGNIKDVKDFYAALDKGVLPAVSYVKPDSFVDGHPASSKLDLFEAMISNIHNKLKANPALFKETAFIVAFDEGGGYWDSGFFQPIDFFGDGPRTPFIVVSPHSKGGKVVHTYQDHASILKFIERNWGLSPLTQRSRDNLPNPKKQKRNPYVPANMPAVGDLFDMFHFKK
ncbi:MAG: alkaline phosphatase family protein, partial [Methylococcaceae bacterium]|nr:alkaline phosphatase family protein [Methylococcaceae bacterium]